SESSDSSTRRTPSTPTAPDSVGRPPRKARRNSLSQRLSRLVRTPPETDAGAAVSPDFAVRTDFPWIAMRRGSVAKCGVGQQTPSLHGVDVYGSVPGLRQRGAKAAGTRDDFAKGQKIAGRTAARERAIPGSRSAALCGKLPFPRECRRGSHGYVLRVGGGPVQPGSRR